MSTLSRRKVVGALSVALLLSSPVTSSQKYLNDEGVKSFACMIDKIAEVVGSEQLPHDIDQARAEFSEKNQLSVDEAHRIMQEAQKVMGTVQDDAARAELCSCIKKLQVNIEPELLHAQLDADCCKKLEAITHDVMQLAPERMTSNMRELHTMLGNHQNVELIHAQQVLEDAAAVLQECHNCIQNDARVVEIWENIQDVSEVINARRSMMSDLQEWGLI